MTKKRTPARNTFTVNIPPDALKNALNDAKAYDAIMASLQSASLNTQLGSGGYPRVNYNPRSLDDQIRKMNDAMAAFSKSVGQAAYEALKNFTDALNQGTLTDAREKLALLKFMLGELALNSWLVNIETDHEAQTVTMSALHDEELGPICFVAQLNPQDHYATLIDLTLAVIDRAKQLDPTYTA